MMMVVVMMMMMMMMSVCKCRQVGKGSLDDWKREREGEPSTCLLYTSDAADDWLVV